MNFDIANLVVNIGQANPSFNWGSFFTALFGAGFGAWSAYSFNVIYENKKQFKNETNILRKYLYNLHYILRNTSTFYHAYIQISNSKDINLPLEYMNFTFNNSELGFVAENNSIYYEGIMQLQTDIKALYEVALNYNNTHSDIYLGGISELMLPTIIKIVAMIRNTDKYLIKYHKCNSFINKNIASNIESAETTIKEHIARIENGSLPAPHNYTKMQKETQEGWTIKFDDDKETLNRKTIYSDLKNFFTTYCVNCFNYFLPDKLYIKIKNKNKTGGRK